MPNLLVKGVVNSEAKAEPMYEIVEVIRFGGGQPRSNKWITKEELRKLYPWVGLTPDAPEDSPDNNGV